MKFAPYGRENKFFADLAGEYSTVLLFFVFSGVLWHHAAPHRLVLVVRQTSGLAERLGAGI